MTKQQYITKQEWREIFRSIFLLLVLSFFSILSFWAVLTLPPTAAEMKSMEVFGAVTTVSIFGLSVTGATFYLLWIWRILQDD